MKITPRTRKLNETVKEALAAILLEEVSDPRLHMVTITSVEVSSDVSLANVWVTAHGDQDRYQEVIEGLNSASGRIRSALGRRVRMRLTPELRFKIDTSIDEGMRISSVLKEAAQLLPADHPAPDDDTD